MLAALLFLIPPTAALPSSSPLSLISRFTSSEECQLPPPANTCTGAATKDVIVHWNKNTTQSEKELFLNAAKASGAVVHEVMDSFGFTAFIPAHVVELMAAHGATCGTKVYENGCAGVPWCGEAPC